MTSFEAFFNFTGTPFGSEFAVEQLLETESRQELLVR